jgi:NTP pyrophosphatase (non-canonical NTP hydrolase)
MDFKSYQEFVNTTKVYPEKHAIVYPALGLAGEAGEVSEKIKKWLRGDRDLDISELAKELGDVLWYIASMCTDLDVSMADVAQLNIDKLSSRKERGVLHGSGDNR